MEPTKNDYHISFFKPTTVQAKFNRNLVILLVCIWAVAVFGFHFLLRAIEKPTPEEAYTQYENVWENVKNENANVAEYQTFVHSTLSVLGKIFISAEERAVLGNAFSWTTYQLADSAQKEMLVTDVANLEKIKSEITIITDEKYVQAKNDLMMKLIPMLGLDTYDPRTRLAPIELVSADMKEFKDENIEEIPTIMSKYLIHNQSVLTDTKFLGFPFHYFYTAVFLLILFVFLCWLYCVRVDRRNKILNIQE